MEYGGRCCASDTSIFCSWPFPREIRLGTYRTSRTLWFCAPCAIVAFTFQFFGMDDSKGRISGIEHSDFQNYYGGCVDSNGRRTSIQQSMLTFFFCNFATLHIPTKEQFVYWSWISNSLYHGAMAAMQGLTTQQCYHRITEVLWDTQVAQWTFWIPIQLLNFQFVPVRHQLNVVLLTSIVWTALLSMWYPPQTDVDVNDPEILNKRIDSASSHIASHA